MSESEFLAIGFGLFIGYWVISKLISSDETSQTKFQNDQTNSQTDQQTQRDDLAWHEVLGVSPNAPLDEIHLAYKSLIRQYHPDKVANLGVELKNLAEEKSKTINAAYQTALKVRGA